MIRWRSPQIFLVKVSFLRVLMQSGNDILRANGVIGEGGQGEESLWGGGFWGIVHPPPPNGGGGGTMTGITLVRSGTTLKRGEG